MIRLLSGLFGLTLILLLAALLLLGLAREDEPRLRGSVPLTPASAPAPATAELRTAAGSLMVPARQLSLFANLLAEGIARGLSHGRIASDVVGGTRGRAQVTISAGRAEALATIALPPPVGGYLNLQTHLIETDDLPALASLEVGRLRLPATLAQPLMRHLLRPATRLGLLQRVRFEPDQVLLDLDWTAGTDPALAAAAPERALMEAAWARLAQAVAAADGPTLDLANLLEALLPPPSALAQGDVPAVMLTATGTGTRTGATRDPDPVASNRAALLVLATYVNARGFGLPVAAAVDPAQRPILLRGRTDLAQHYTASAAISLLAGSSLSHLVGLAKELDDAERGSGFSFADLAANRAGIRLAELATGDREGAHRVQVMARAGLDENALMPAIDGLPEGIGGATLRARWISNEAAAFRRLVAHIDQRIATLALVRYASPSS